MRPSLSNMPALSVGLAAALCALILAACGAPEAPAEVATQAAPVVAASPAVAGGNPLHTLRRERSIVSGSVREVLVTGHYTYVRIERDDAPAAWVVTLGESHQLGDAVEARVFGVKRDFRSARLGRTFDTLHFGVIDGPAKLSLR